MQRDKTDGTGQVVGLNLQGIGVVKYSEEVPEVSTNSQQGLRRQMQGGRPKRDVRCQLECDQVALGPLSWVLVLVKLQCPSRVARPTWHLSSDDGSIVSSDTAAVSQEVQFAPSQS